MIINKTPITYYGGKQQMVSKIVPLIPEHEVYIEPFCGGAAIMFAKPKSKLEVLNDTHEFVSAFWRQMILNFDELNEQIQSIPHSRSIFNEYRKIKKEGSDSELTRAVCFYVLTQQGFLSKFDGSWGYSLQGRGSVSNMLANKRDKFPEYKERLRSVQIDCIDGLKCIQKYDFEKSFFFIDPPYIHTDCGHYGGYTEADYEKLLKLLSTTKAKWMLTSYPNDPLERAVAEYGWSYQEIDKPLCAHKSTDGTRPRKTETITTNYLPKCPEAHILAA